MSSSRKRKDRDTSYTSRSSGDTTFHQNDPDSYPLRLFIQAHEADVIRGTHAISTAISLEVLEPNGEPSKDSSRRTGDGLIKWTGVNDQNRPAFPADADDEVQDSTPNDDVAIWVDSGKLLKYDARLLLDSLLVPQPVDAAEPVPDSPGGWSDLPSDTEDTFFFSPEEAEDYHRDKRRRHLQQVREERLQARQAEDGEAPENVWGDSDEEADEGQKELMRRTAAHILSSPNPAQLEIRILANHGSDKRFAFLRGRWKRTWHLLKAKAKIEKESTAKGAPNPGLGVLAEYPDSSGESDDAGDVEVESSIELEPTRGHQGADDMVKEARRARAREWAERRRALKDTG